MNRARTLLLVALGLLAVVLICAAARIAPMPLAEDGTPGPHR